MSHPIPFCDKHQEAKRHSAGNYRCRSCQREYRKAGGHQKKQQELRAARRAAWIEANGPCKRCGSTQELEVDHIDPATKDPRLKGPRAAAVWAWSEENRAAELAKCQVLCSVCHLKKTVDEAGGPRQHGSFGMYTRHACRCEACREAARLAARSYYARNREKSKAYLRLTYWRRKIRNSSDPSSVVLPEDLRGSLYCTDSRWSECDGH
jgi:5-methylcytosine-specific restriction endonuclease McrA